MAMVPVRVTRAHDNEYGDAYEKGIGDTYHLPETAFQSLKANGYVERTDTKALTSRATPKV